MTCIKVFCTRLHVVDVEWGDRLAISLPGPDSVRYMGHCVVVFSTFFHHPTHVVSSTSGTLPSVRLEPPSGITGSRAAVCAVFEQMAGVSASVCENGGRLDMASCDCPSRVVRHDDCVGCVRVSGSRGVGQ
jgi:hypothetical protein